MYKDVPGRLLRLLSLLQSRRSWTGPELAERLGVTDRTIRRDVDRLREMGYAVESVTGLAGGYRLTSGADLPPLLMDDDEAVAVAVSLLVTSAGVEGSEESGPRALAKLLQVLPTRLRMSVPSVADATVSLTGNQPRTTIDPSVLATVAGSIRDREVLRIQYQRRREPTARKIEPYRIVTGYGLWYLVSFDLDAGQWRPLRIDRIVRADSTFLRFEPRDLPTGNPIDFVLERLRQRPTRYAVRALVEADHETVRRWLPSTLPSRIRSAGVGRTTLELDADEITFIARDLQALQAPYSLEASPDVTVALQEVIDRLSNALAPRETD